MNIEIYEKPVITKFVSVDGVEFELGKLYGCLNQLLEETKEDDHYGDYSLRDYEVHDLKTMRKLVNMGFVKNYTGSRMADLYCMEDKNKISSLLDALYNLDS